MIPHRCKYLHIREIAYRQRKKTNCIMLAGKPCCMRFNAFRTTALCEEIHRIDGATSNTNYGIEQGGSMFHGKKIPCVACVICADFFDYRIVPFATNRYCCSSSFIGMTNGRRYFTL